MASPEALDRWRRDGFAILRGHLQRDALRPALAELSTVLPSAETFHGRPRDRSLARFRSEFGGITNFPFASVELNLLAVHAGLVDLAVELLGVDDVRVYAIEAWAKFTGAADYEQPHHRDYLNHSLLVPAPSHAARQVEMFLYLDDVPADLGPPALVPMPATAGLPAIPNWYPPEDGPPDPEHPTWRSEIGRPDLYDAERVADGPAGTVVAYRIETFHRGTALRRPRGARATIHVNFRDARADWLGRRAWTDCANEQPWHDFVCRASPRQLALFGFPPPGDAYWTDETITGMAQRYPGFDGSRWRA